jgi:predicted enzyme related to lactoylglutathione lyase
MDLLRAQTFYEEVFNWEFFRYGDSSVVHFRSGSIAGMVLQVEERNHYTLAHDHSQGVMIANNSKCMSARAVGFTIQVEDMGKTLSEVKKAGGRIWL